MKKHKQLQLRSDTIRELSVLDLRAPRGGVRNDSLQEPTCDPCGDWPTTPYRGCNTVV